jgi:preprotein translocase subunit SecA
MLKGLLGRLVGDVNEKELKRLQPTVDQINALEPEYERCSDQELRACTSEFKDTAQGRVADLRIEVEGLRQELLVEPDAERRRDLDIELQAATRRLRSAEEQILEELLPRAFAVVREAAKRTLAQRHFDVQLLGGLVLHQGKIAEMRTGEGKTITATLPLYLNSLLGHGAHLVTPNDYLSKFGVQWMGPIYHLLGVSVGVIQSAAQNPELGSFVFDPTYAAVDDRYQRLRPVARREAYQADITYGTNNEFGFDYLRDNMVWDLSQCVQRELHYAIVDEVDNILIDESRTPLIISGAAEESTDNYVRFARLMPRLRAETDYTVDEKLRIVTLTEEGITKLESMLGLDNLYSPKHYDLTPYMENALKAHVLFRRDRDYIVKDGQVIIVDEFTGRLMYGRRYSEGLHQAIEAKEGVRVQRESLTMATITFQNYFRMYSKLAGMTGTAATEAEEFRAIYGLEVMVLPTNVEHMAAQPGSDLQARSERVNGAEITRYFRRSNPDQAAFFKRVDYPDLVYKTEAAKFRAVVDEIVQSQEQGRPVLVGTTSVEKSELLSDMLRRRGVEHQVLNAKQHEKEALVIAQAGRPGTVSIATNMAGRGVDILLGGNPEGMARDDLRRHGVDLTTVDAQVWADVVEHASNSSAQDRLRVLAEGGLHIVGTERHEARRIDNQLRGRAGRQGDPGSSRFFVSLEDDLMRRFGGSTVAGLMDRLGVDEDIPIEHDLISRSIENSQIKVEGFNFDLRKHLLEYDDVVNQQRRLIYDQRRLILSSGNLKDTILGMVQEELSASVARHTAGDPMEWDLPGLLQMVRSILPLQRDFNPTWASKSPEQIEDELARLADLLYAAKERPLGPELQSELQGLAGVGSLEPQWTSYLKEQALGPDLLRQLERLVMLRAVDTHWVRHLTALDELREGIGLRAFAQRDPLVEYKREAFDMFDGLKEAISEDVARKIYFSTLVQQPMSRPTRAFRPGLDGERARPAPRSAGAKIGRNDPCPCGSGKKYKKCCGAGAAPSAEGTSQSQGNAVRSAKRQKPKKKHR